jgi:uncharacterized protein YjbI with pentapeptide repeats
MIRKGVKAWNAWRLNGLRGKPDLIAARLTQLDLTGAHLQEADLGSAELFGAILMRANLMEADLSHAHLAGANLFAANLLNANLIKVDITDADLSDAILKWAKLCGAHALNAKLRDAELFGADLTGACLSEADLRRADLREAKLNGASLETADLREADLTGADLTDVDLSGADLSGATLDCANLTTAVVRQTAFGNNDLSTTNGLETLEHLGPSTIGLQTLYRSKGNIPEVFLRGAGLPEDFITYLPSLMARPIEFYSCFISYSHADKSFARRLHDSLQARGIRCWLDEHELLPGDKIYTEVDRGIRLWDKVLLCCSKDALTSWWVDNEIKIAFDKEQQLWKQRGKEVLALIPLNLDDYLFSGAWQSGLATEVKARLAAHFGGWEQDNKKFDEQFERLVKALRTDTRGKDPPPPTLL